MPQGKASVCSKLLTRENSRNGIVPQHGTASLITMSPFGPKAKRFGKLHMSAARGRPEIGDVAFDSRR